MHHRIFLYIFWGGSGEYIKFEIILFLYKILFADFFFFYKTTKC